MNPWCLKPEFHHSNFQIHSLSYIWLQTGSDCLSVLRFPMYCIIWGLLNFIPIWKFFVLSLFQFFSEIPKTIIMRHNNFQRRFSVCHKLSPLQSGSTVNIVLLRPNSIFSLYWNGITSFSAVSVETVLTMRRWILSIFNLLLMTTPLTFLLY